MNKLMASCASEGLSGDSEAQVNRILWLDVARAFAILSITCNHAVNRAWDNYTDQFSEFVSIGYISTLIKALITIFSRIGVPIFLMISGALLLNKCISTDDDVKRFYKHNLLRLLVTAEIWYAIMYWFIVFFDTGNTMLETMSAWQLIWGMIKNALFIDQVTLGSMWYMPVIICVYIVIPFAVIVKDKISAKVLIPALLIVFLSKMVVPAYNSHAMLLGGAKEITFELSGNNVFSMYLLYIIAGYWIKNGGMGKMPSWSIICGSLISFLLMIAYQFWAYSRPENFLLDYDYPILLICAMFVFEFIRRFGKSLIRFERPITYISIMSFGIYFVHVIILWACHWYIDFSSWGHTAHFAFLEAVSLFGSILIIAVLSKKRFCKKYLFMVH